MGDDVAARIRNYVTEELLLDAASSPALTDEVNLLESIDSLGLTQLVAFLEDTFEIHIDEAEITADNFRTVNDISRLVRERAGQG